MTFFTLNMSGMRRAWAAAGRAILLVAVVGVGVLQVPAARATSVYSLNLIGERMEAGDVRSVALGGAAQLVPDTLGVLQLNPAMLTRLTKVTVGAAQYLALDEAQSAQFKERDISLTFGTFRAAFPIASGLVFSLGYRGRYDPDGSFAERDATPAGQIFTQTTLKRGGLFSIPFTAAFDVTRYASVGLTFSLEQGSVEEQVNIVFDNRLLPASDNRRTEDFNGTGYAAGITLHPTDDLIVGAMFESEIDYDTDVRIDFDQSVLDTSYESRATLPAQTTFGITWQPGGTWLVAASAAWRDFADFRGLGFPAARLDREESYAFGIEYGRGLPLRGRRFPLRLSVNVQKLPYEHPIGTEIDKFLIGFGTGIVLGEGRGKLDIAIVGGKIGSTAENLVEDQVFRIYLGIGGGEVWKRRVTGDL